MTKQEEITKDISRAKKFFENITAYTVGVFTLEDIIKITQQAIADALGCSAAKINKRADRNSRYTNEELIKISNYFGIELVEDSIVNEVLSNYNHMYSNFFTADYYPAEPGSIQNGKFIYSNNKMQISIPKELVSSYSACRKYFVIKASGKSMEPEIKDGDKLIIESCMKNEQIKDNRIYLFYYNGRFFCRRLIQNINQLIVISDNQDKSIYPAEFIPEKNINDVLITGRVSGLIRDIDL